MGFFDKRRYGREGRCGVWSGCKAGEPVIPIAAFSGRLSAALEKFFCSRRAVNAPGFPGQKFEGPVASKHSGEIALRYATALFELADEGHALDAVAGDLRAVKTMLAESEDLRRLVRSPVISRAEQGAALGAVLQRANASALVRNFVALVAANRRLFALDRMIDAYLAELAARRGEVTAEVTAAQALSEIQTKSLTEALKKLIGAKVSVQLRVDRDLLGGLVVKIGSKLFDASLKTKLRKLELAMKGAG